MPINTADIKYAPTSKERMEKARMLNRILFKPLLSNEELSIFAIVKLSSFFNRF
jgi:hypothetical protein